jgi:membrane-bound metal-dependent hydrolase YbcI (DUF457 family)
MSLLVLGAYLPDIVDKPLALLTGLSGRGYAHSLVVQALVFGVLFVVARCHTRPLAALALGSVLHLLQDWPPLGVVLAPLLGPIPHEPAATFLARILRFYTTPGAQLALECAAVLYWLAAGVSALSRRAGQTNAPGLVSAPPRKPA